MTSLSVDPSINLPLQIFKSKSLKQFRSEFSFIIKSKYYISFTYFFSSKKPLMRRVLKYPKKSESRPLINSTYSYVSLNGAVSKFMFPGELPKTNPKSI